MKLISGKISKAMVVALLLNNSLINDGNAMMVESETGKHHRH